MIMSIVGTGLYCSATHSDLFNDVQDFKERVTTLTTSYLKETKTKHLTYLRHKIPARTSHKIDRHP